MATRVSQALPRDLRYERTPKRVRAVLAGETLADSTAALLVWEPRRAVPAYAFPEADVRDDLLRASENPVPDAHGGGARSSPPAPATRSPRTRPGATPTPTSPATSRSAWEAMDHWYEEDEEVFGHPRDPWHRVDARRSARHVRVEIGGETVADSRRPMIVFETGLPTRYYLPRSDVAMERLEATETRTICAYKGFASYWSVGEERDVAWTLRGAVPRRSADRRPRLLPQRADRHRRSTASPSSAPRRSGRRASARRRAAAAAARARARTRSRTPEAGAGERLPCEAVASYFEELEAVLDGARAAHAETLERVPAGLRASLPVDATGVTQAIEILATAVGIDAEVLAERDRLNRAQPGGPARPRVRPARRSPRRPSSPRSPRARASAPSSSSAWRSRSTAARCATRSARCSPITRRPSRTARRTRTRRPAGGRRGWPRCAPPTTRRSGRCCCARAASTRGGA